MLTVNFKKIASLFQLSSCLHDFPTNASKLYRAAYFLINISQFVISIHCLSNKKVKWMRHSHVFHNETTQKLTYFYSEKTIPKTMRVSHLVALILLGVTTYYYRKVELSILATLSLIKLIHNCWISSAKLSDIPNYFASTAKEYDRVGVGFPKDKTFILVNGKQMDRKQVFTTAIEIDSKYARAYFNLGTLLSDTETINMTIDGKPEGFTKRRLYLEAIALGCTSSSAFNNLGELLKNETIDVMINGIPKNFSKRQLFLKAIALGVRSGQPFLNLADTLTLLVAEKEDIEVIEVTIDGKKRMMSAAELRLEAQRF